MYIRIAMLWTILSFTLVNSVQVTTYQILSLKQLVSTNLVYSPFTWGRAQQWPYIQYFQTASQHL